MNKTEWVKAVAEKSGYTEKDVKAVLEAGMNVIKEKTTKDKEPVQLIGFGTFAPKTRAARTGRNPQTGKAIKIPASDTVTFKKGKWS